jgi:hypothetical protein
LRLRSPDRTSGQNDPRQVPEAGAHPVSKEVERAMRLAVKAAGRRLPFKSEKATNALLEYAAGDMAEAYRIGAEEAQSEIIRRLLTLNVETPVRAPRLAKPAS